MPLIDSLTKHHIVGTPDMVRAGLLATAERYGAGELIIAANCFSFTERVRSFELIAQACALVGPVPAAAG